MLRILYDDFDQKVKNIHDEMDLHHSYKKKRVTHLARFLFYFVLTFTHLKCGNISLICSVSTKANRANYYHYYFIV